MTVQVAVAPSDEPRGPAMDPVVWRQMREQFLVVVGKGLDDPTANAVGYAEVRDRWEPYVRGLYEEAGFRLARAHWDAQWRKAFPLAPPRDVEAFFGYLWAICMPYDAELDEHFDDRKADGGNTIADCYGIAGTWKSTGMISLAHRRAPFKPGTVLRRVVFDQENVRDAFNAMAEDEWAVLDEQTPKSGQGSEVEEKEYVILEEQGRASRKSLIKISNRPRDPDPQRVTFYSFAGNKQAKRVVYVVQHNEVWLGHVTESWMPPEVYEEYKPPKDERVANAIQGTLRSRAKMTRVVNECAFDPEFARILLRKGRVKPSDFRVAIRETLPRFVDARTESDLSKRAESLAKNWSVFEANFRGRYGVEPAPVWAELARKFGNRK